MKKYFISFNYETVNGFNGFANTSKNSLKKDVTIEDIRSWEKEIASTPRVKKVKILFFKEIK